VHLFGTFLTTSGSLLDSTSCCYFPQAGIVSAANLWTIMGSPNAGLIEHFSEIVFSIVFEESCEVQHYFSSNMSSHQSESNHCFGRTSH